MAEFASRGTATAGLTTGIIGTALGVMAGGLNNLGLFGNTNNGCSDDHYVNRYEIQQQQKISELQAQISLRDANTFTDQKLNDFRNYVDSRFAYFSGKLEEQAVYNATNTSTLNCMAQQIAQLQGLTKLVIPITSVCPEPAVASTTTT